MERNHSYTIFAIGRQMESKPYTFVKEKFVRSLDHDPGTITGIVFAAAGTPVLHIFKDRECI